MLEIAGFMQARRELVVAVFGLDEIWIPALAALVGVPASVKHLEAIPVRLLYAADDGRIACRDPWGRRLRYLTALIADTEGKRRVARNGGRPIFESAGPDGRFGQSTDPATADDIRSDEPW